jgi:transposase-like protein
MAERGVSVDHARLSSTRATRTLQNMNWLLMIQGWFWLIEILQVKYLNNIIEQDHVSGSLAA